jgi:hypothetical protein
MHAGLSSCPRLIKMLTAHSNIAIIAANFGLRAVNNCFAKFVDPQVHRRFAPAIADALKLNQTVRYDKQSGGTVKQLALKIGT